MPFLEDADDRLESQYRPLYDTWKLDPNPKNTGKFLKSLQPVIDQGIRAHVGQTNPLIQSRARKMTVQALGNYDPKKAQLNTYIINQLQGLKRVARQQTQVLRMPERVVLDQNRLFAAQQELMDDLGRDPNINELADYTGLAPRRISYLRKFKHPVAEGTLMSQTDASEDDTYAPAVTQYGDDPWIDIIHDDLDPIGQKIMEWTLGLYGEQKLPNHEIARRLRLSPGAISQRKAVIQRMLDEGERRSPFQ